VTRHVVLREISLTGVYGRKIDETWIVTERLLRSHASAVASVVTDRLPLSDFDRAFEKDRSETDPLGLFLAGASKSE
jgi:threonine 3-dehydrogenase